MTLRVETIDGRICLIFTEDGAERVFPMKDREAVTALMIELLRAVRRVGG